MGGLATRIPGILALALLGLLLSGGTAAAAIPPGCAHGMAALQSGRLQQAETIYGEVRPPGAVCARQGLTAATALLQARHLIDVGLDSAAEAEITLALRAEPGLSVPGNVMPEVVGQPGISLAKALDRDGFHTQAQEILLQVVRNDPGIRLDRDAQRILGLTGHSVLWHVQHFVLSLDGLGVLIIGVILVPRLRRRLYFQEFSDEDAGPGAGQAAPLRERILAELHRLAEESARLPNGRPLRLDQAGPYDGEFELKDITGDLSLPWKVICALASVVPPRSRLVNGFLFPDIELRLRLDTVGGVNRRNTMIRHDDLNLPAPDPDDAEGRFAQLALPAAAWIILKHYPRKVRLGGTRDWASFRDFAAGCAWQDTSDAQRANGLGHEAEESLKKASDLFQRACSDEENTAAAINLAALQQRLEPAAVLDDPAGTPWFGPLRALVTATKAKDDLQWYRARYLLSLGIQDIVDRGELAADTPSPVIELARTCAVDLAIELEKRSRDPGHLPSTFVSSNRPAALTLVARQVMPQTQNPADVLTEVPVRAQPAGSSISHVLKSVRRGPRKGAAEELVEFVRSNFSQIDASAKYNLYRYYQERAQALAGAVDNLDSGEGLGLEELPSAREQLVAAYQATLGQLTYYGDEAAKDPGLADRIKNDPPPDADRTRSTDVERLG